MHAIHNTTCMYDYASDQCGSTQFIHPHLHATILLLVFFCTALVLGEYVLYNFCGQDLKAYVVLRSNFLNLISED